ncbi:hypothetical protein [Plantibacter sp. YIM 135347]|jgi:hypothetical protein|uniref:hypothetical protein n=1 Tax=Plantibacter sp. YIM 135347 TaxID=3423919 RepID=UPI003D33BC35
MRTSTIVRSGIASVVLIAVLSGCAIGAPSAKRSPSRSLATVEAAVSEVPGATFSAARAWDGTTAYVTATLKASDAFTGDPAQLVDYSLAQLASQDEVDRGRFVRFAFEAPGQTVETTRALLASLDVDSDQYAGGSSLELASADLDKRYGAWPAAVPELPASLGATG